MTASISDTASRLAEGFKPKITARLRHEIVIQIKTRASQRHAAGDLRRYVSFDEVERKLTLLALWENAYVLRK